MKKLNELEAVATKGKILIKRDRELYGENGYFIGDVSDSTGNVDEMDKANAQLLAHRWNTHGELLEALKECESLIRTAYIEDSMTTIDRAQQAIQNAEEAK